MLETIISSALFIYQTGFAKFLALPALARNIIAWVAGCGACWKSITRLLQPVLKKWLASSCVGCLTGCQGPSLGWLYVFSLHRTRLGDKAMATLNGILATSTPLKATEVKIQYLKVRIGFWIGVRIRVSGVKVVLDWTPKEEWENHADAVKAGVKAGMTKAAADTIAAVQGHLKSGGCVGQRVKGLIERIINRVDIKVKDVQVHIPCGETEVTLGVNRLNVYLGRCWTYEQGGSQLYVWVEPKIRAGSEDLLQPLPLQVTVKLPRLLRTVLSKADTDKMRAKKKLDATVKVEAIDLALKTGVLGNLLTAADHFTQFSQWKAPIADSVESSLETLKSSDKSAYVAALKARKDVTQWEERITRRDIIGVHAEVEQWPIPAHMTLEDWLGEINLTSLPVREVLWSVTVKSVRMEVLTEDWLKDHGINLAVQGLSLDGDLHIASALEETTALIVKPMALQVDAKMALKSVAISCEKPGTLENPILEPISVKAAFVAGKEEISVEASVAESQEHENSDGDGSCAITLSPRAIYKLEKVALGFSRAMPPKRPPPPEMAMLKVRARERAHRDDVACRFSNYDPNNSGVLEEANIFRLVDELYGDMMTAEEVQTATKQLYRTLDRDGDGGVSLDELQNYFKGVEQEGAKGGICIKFGEYARALPEDFDAWYTFERKILNVLSENEDIETVTPKVLQVRWVRTISNFEGAKQNWTEVIQPRLKRISKRDDMKWILSERENAVDFWNNPILQLSDLDALQQQEQSDTQKVKIKFDVSGLSIRYADNQLPVSFPRVSVDVYSVKLNGAIGFPTPEKPRMNFDIVGGLKLKATYWNELHYRAEPFLEDWFVDISGKGASLKVCAPKHLTVNLTPPLLQAVGVLADSLSLSEKKRNAIVQSIPKDYEKEAEGAAAWIVNLTALDLKVCLKGPTGKGKFITIKKTQKDEAFKLPIHTGSSKSILTSNTDDPDAYTLGFESANKGEWEISDTVRFAVAGQRVYYISKLEAYLVVDVALDVLVQAPIITLSGLSTLTNASRTPIEMTLDSGPKELKPIEVISAGIGGRGMGKTLRFGDITIPVPGDKDIVEVAMCSYEKEHNHRMFARFARQTGMQEGTKFKDVQMKLMQQKGLRVFYKLTSFANNRDVKGLQIMLYPMLRLSNLLPAKLKCGVKRDFPDEPSRLTLSSRLYHSHLHEHLEEFIKDAELPFEVLPGGLIGLPEVSKQDTITIPLEFEGHKYCVVLKGPSEELLTMKVVKKLRKKSERGQAVKAKVHKFTDAAPYIDCQLDWEGGTVVLKVFSRWIVTNRTGRHIDITAGGRFSSSGKNEHVRTWKMTGASWDAGVNVPPNYALMHVSKGFSKVGTFQIRLAGAKEDSEDSWEWDASKAAGPLLHWPVLPTVSPPPSARGLNDEGGANATNGANDDSGDAEADWEAKVTSQWSETIPASIATSSPVEMKPPTGQVLGGGIVGVAVDELQFPFQLTRMINITPRFIVVNRLDKAIKLWPQWGKSQHVPSDVVPPSLPVAPSNAYVAIDAIVHTQQSMLSGYSKEEEPLLSVRFDDPVSDHVEADAFHLKEGILETLLDDIDQVADETRRKAANARKAAVARVRSLRGTTNTPAVATEGSQGVQQEGSADNVPDQEDEPVIHSLPGRWSYCVPLWRAGDTLMCVKRTKETMIGSAAEDSIRESISRANISDDPVEDDIDEIWQDEEHAHDMVIRASVQQEGSTNFIVIASGTFPYCVQNRSVAYTLVFSQLDDSTGAPEMIVKPCSYQRFIFPDPDAPKILLGRIRGAGEKAVVKYDFTDLSHPETPPLTYISQFGESVVALEARMFLEGSLGTLAFHNPKSVMIRREKEDSSAPKFEFLNTVVTSLDVTVFLAGLHVCLVDTSLEKNYSELVGVTVDYVELRKAVNTNEVQLDVYHMQIDDFNSPGQFIVGPRNSGLNSRRQGLESDAVGHPWFNVSVGWKNLEAVMQNAAKGVFTVQHFSLELMPMEVYADVPKLLQIINALTSWLQVGDAMIPDAAFTGTKVLANALSAGVATPGLSGQKLLFLADLALSSVSLDTHVKFSSRRGADADEEDGNTDEKLTNLMAKLPPSAQPLLGGLSHASLSFADISPSFKFGKFQRDNLNGTIAPIVTSIKNFYVTQILQQAVMVIGSVKLLGDPTKVVGDVSKGFTLMIRETGQELRGEAKFRLRGVVDFAETVVGSALGAIADSTGAMKDTIGGIAGRPIGNDYTPKSLAEGIDGGMSVFAEGFSHCISDIVLIPKAKVANLDDDGSFVKAVLVGSAQGFYAIWARPLEGALGSVEKLARGAENATHGRSKGFDGWRRPLRGGFVEGATLLPLEEGLFWPLWQIKIVGISLPCLWDERRVGQVAVTLAKRSGTLVSEILLDRGEEDDTWTAVPRSDGGDLDKDEAGGRVGDLLGPMKLQVIALLQGNLGMVEPLRQIVGYATLETSRLVSALTKNDTAAQGLQLTIDVDVIAVRSQIQGTLHQEGDNIGQVSFQFGPCIDQRVTPEGLAPAQGGVTLVHKAPEPEETPQSTVAEREVSRGPRPLI